MQANADGWYKPSGRKRQTVTLSHNCTISRECCSSPPLSSPPPPPHPLFLRQHQHAHMAAKPAAASPESSSTAALAQNPPTISLSSHVLSSALKFPSEPVIAYAIYSTSGTGLSTVHSENVELARREVLRRRTTTNTNTTGTQPNTSTSTSTKHGILESLLASVLVERETLHLYVFGVSSVGETMQWSETLKALNFDGLTRELLSLSTDF